MEFGITLPRNDVAGQPSPLKYLSEVVREGERMGYVYCVIGDRLESGMDPFVTLAAVAEASGHMRLVTSILILPPRGILVASKQYASLDVLSSGRVIAGVGPGSTFRDYEGVGAMRSHLTPGAQPFKGKFYSTEGVNLVPKSFQENGIPIWIGSWGSRVGLCRVARLADGWLTSAGPGHQSPEQFAEDVNKLNTFLLQEGRDPSSFPNAISTMAMFISEDKEELATIGGPGYVPRPTGVGIAQPAKRPFEEVHAHDMVGTRADCIDKLSQWEAAGAQALFLGPRGPHLLGQMRTFMNDVASKA